MFLTKDKSDQQKLHYVMTDVSLSKNDAPKTSRRPLAHLQIMAVLKINTNLNFTQLMNT